jgi:starch-binding outer membrane protein, SusD/RagB family
MRNKWIKILGALVIGVTIFACKKSFLERPPQGIFTEASLANAKGINTTLIAGYALLDGWYDNGWNNAAGNPWPVAGSNWIWGSVASDDAYPGSEPNDQAGVERVNRYEFIADDPYYRAKFQQCYAGIGKTNVSLRLINASKELTAAEKAQLAGEAKFLRAHYHFDAYKMWVNVPFIDENTTEYRQKNDVDIFPKIEQDFKDAIAGLAEVSSVSSGRATKGAAQAYLARAYMFVGKYAEAKPLLQAVIASGKYSLVNNFHDNFDASKQNNSEMLFAFKASVNDGANESHNGNWGDRLNSPHGNAPVTQCCGFHQPSQNLINAYKTDASGLPLFTTFNNANFDQAADNVDPRLDWTAGRTDVPYMDWGPQKDNWIRNVGYCGNFAPRKNVFHKGQAGTLSTASGWSTAPNAIDIPFIRYSDVLLMAAECEIETNGDLNLARTYINQVRARAGKFVQGAGTNEATISAALPAPVATVVSATVNATKYKVGEYTTPFANQADARRAVRWERRLELAMEGYRFFDLRRWNDLQTLTDFLTVEKTRRTQLYAGTQQPTATKLKYYPLPSVEIDLSKIDGVAQLKQNAGY